jgi:putative ABC transport system permease protein
MLPKLAVGNLRRNFHNYWAYFLSAAFSAFVLYLFLSITFGKVTGEVSQYQVCAAVFTIGAFLTGLFTVFFIWYSNSFFIKSRKKEFATYMLLGMTKRQTVLLSFIENLVILVLAFAVGIVAGILLNKALIMLLFSIIQVRAEVSFEVNLEAFKTCAYVYLGVFALITLHSTLLLRKTSLINLIHASKKSEKVLKVSKKTYVFAVIAVILLGLGYYQAVALANPLLWFQIVIMICIGTALLFASLGALFFHFRRKNEAGMYKGTSLITVSQLMHRYRGNVGVLSVIAITTSVALCAVLACCSLFALVNGNSRAERPFSVEYAVFDANANAAYADALKSHPEVKETASAEIRLLNVQARTNEYPQSQDYFIVGETVYNQAMAALKRPAIPRIASEGDTVLVLAYDSSKAKDVKVDLKGTTLPLSITRTEVKSFMSLDRFRCTLVVQDALYDKLKNTPGAEETVLMGRMLENDMRAGDFTADLRKVLPKESKLKTFYENYMSEIGLQGVLVFVGVFVGLLFVAATGSILYYRMSMEAREDSMNYVTLRKLGVSGREIRNAVAKQLGMIFGLPLALAAINAFAAVFQLEMIIKSYGASTLKSTYLVILGIYMLFYGAYYLLTLKKYVKTVTRSS